jgi:hypothetical protein
MGGAIVAPAVSEAAWAGCQWWASGVVGAVRRPGVRD